MQFQKGHTTWNKGRKYPQVTGEKSNFWKGGQVEKSCFTCSKTFFEYPSRKDRKFCSNKCRGKFITGKNNPKYWLGKIRYPKPEDHPQFIDGLNYVTIHKWLKTNYGNPPSCEHCGILGKHLAQKNEKLVWNIHWAKLHSLPYEKERSNFVGLCNSCHRKYDKGLSEVQEYKEWLKLKRSQEQTIS
jgi:hypothetical protein